LADFYLQIKINQVVFTVQIFINNLKGIAMLLQIKSICSVLLIGLLLIPLNYPFAQEFETPRPSPNATVSQTVGITHVTIDYSSPGVKGRKIWGGLVPYNEIWRTGANEVTSITFDDPVKINGNEIPAGTYGIHTIPGKSEWDIIFSKDTEVDAGSQFDVTLAKARALSWVPAFQAATYCLQNDVALEEGLNWIEASVLIKEVYWNTRIKAQLLEKLGKKSEAIAAMQKAIKLGAEMENEPFDYERMTGLLAKWEAQ
jgi:hypothetical protein